MFRSNEISEVCANISTVLSDEELTGKINKLRGGDCNRIKLIK